MIEKITFATALHFQHRLIFTKVSKANNLHTEIAKSFGIMPYPHINGTPGITLPIDVAPVRYFYEAHQTHEQDGGSKSEDSIPSTFPEIETPSCFEVLESEIDINKFLTIYFWILPEIYRCWSEVERIVSKRWHCMSYSRRRRG